MTDTKYPFWGKAAQMGVPMRDERVLAWDSLELPEKKIPLFRHPHPDEGQDPRDIIGVIEHVWYGDESGMQVIYFDGCFLEEHKDYLKDYPMYSNPSIYADRVVDEAMLITSGRLQSITLSKEGGWLGITSTFIFDSPLPESLSNRGGF